MVSKKHLRLNKKSSRSAPPIGAQQNLGNGELAPVLSKRPVRQHGRDSGGRTSGILGEC